MNIEIKDEKFLELLKDVTQNYPEGSICPKVTGWRYSTLEFEAVDDEDGKTYKVNKAKLMKGIKLLFTDFINGEVHFYGMDDFFDGCQWDQNVTDALMQYAIFGKLIYG